MSTEKKEECRYFAAKLKKLYAAKELTQLDLGKAIGVSQPTVAAWLGAESGPKIGQLIRIANFFGVPSVDELIRKVPGGGTSCIVPKRLLLQLVRDAEKGVAMIEEVLPEASPGKKAKKKGKKK